MQIQPVILCGGSGTRLWPLSTSEIPKQFIKIGSNTLLDKTINRLKYLNKYINTLEPILIMHKDHKYESELEIIYEPYMNDTAVAIARATKHIMNKNPDAILLISPADQYVDNVDNYIRDIVSGLNKVDDKNIVLYGIQPTYNETKFGYIIPGDKICFKEKPDILLAEQLISKGALWNAGIFAGKLNTFYSAFSEDILSWNKKEKGPCFDIAVLQVHDHIVAQSGNEWGWNDVGTWDALLEVEDIKKEVEQNLTYVKNSTNIKIVNRSNMIVTCIDCSDLLIVVNDNQILIADINKPYNDELKLHASRINDSVVDKGCNSVNNQSSYSMFIVNCCNLMIHVNDENIFISGTL